MSILQFDSPQLGEEDIALENLLGQGNQIIILYIILIR